MTAAGPDSHWETGGPTPDPPEESRAASSRAESGSHLDQQDDEPIEAYDDEPAEVYEDESPGSDLATGSSRYQAIARLSANPDAVEVFRSIGQIFDALRAERQLRTAADEQRRHLEVSNARLEAELELERTLRRLAEGELARLRKEEGERRKRAQQALDRLLTDASAGSEDEAAPSEDVEPEATGPPEGERSEMAAPTPAPPPHYERAEGRPSPPPPQQLPMPEPPLPSGWRYASDVPQRRRRWFAPWRGRGSDEP